MVRLSSNTGLCTYDTIDAKTCGVKTSRDGKDAMHDEEIEQDFYN